MIVSGTVTKKMVVPIVRLYNQMPEPKYVLAMGACASGGGPFKEGYNVVSAWTNTCRWMSTCLAARRRRKPCSMA